MVSPHSIGCKEEVMLTMLLKPWLPYVTFLTKLSQEERDKGGNEKERETSC